MKTKHLILLSAFLINCLPLFGQDYDLVTEKNTKGHVWYQTYKEPFLGALDKNKKEIVPAIFNSVIEELAPNGRLIFYAKASNAKKTYIFDEYHYMCCGNYEFCNTNKIWNFPDDKIFIFDVQDYSGRRGCIYDNGMTIVPCKYTSQPSLYYNSDIGLNYAQLFNKVNGAYKEGIFANGIEIFSPITYNNAYWRNVDTSIGKFPIFLAEIGDATYYRDIWGNDIQYPMKPEDAEKMVQNSIKRWNEIIDKSDFVFTFNGSKTNKEKGKIGVYCNETKKALLILVDNKFIEIPITYFSKKEFSFFYLQDYSFDNMVYFYNNGNEVKAKISLKSYGIEKELEGNTAKATYTNLRNAFHKE